VYKHILVALDGGAGSEQALKQAIALAQALGAALTAISVIEKLPAYAASAGEVDETRGEIEKFFAKLHASAAQIAQAAGVEMKSAIRAGNAAQAVIRYAEENSVSLIVVGAGTGQGLGGTADKITENAPCSVLIARVNLTIVKVKDAMTRAVTSIAPDMPLNALLQLLVEKQLKAVPVVDGGRIVGIITGGDLLARAGMELRLSLQRTLPADVFSRQIQKLAAEGKTARDIMTSPVITIGEDEPVRQAAALMSQKNIKRLPVVNKQGELVGIISRLDILALVAASGVTTEMLPTVLGSSARVAGDIMFRDVPTVMPDTPLNEVVNKILSTPLRRVVVTDEWRHVLGIIVDTQLVKASLHDKRPGLQNILARLLHAPVDPLTLEGTASEVMNKEVFSVRPDTPLAEIIQLMVEKRIKRLVVTDKERRLVGMVSRESVLKVLAEGRL
jgi:CBS domain-containing protein